MVHHLKKFDKLTSRVLDELRKKNGSDLLKGTLKNLLKVTYENPQVRL